MRKTLFSANAITLLRISGTAVLLFLRPFSHIIIRHRTPEIRT